MKRHWIDYTAEVTESPMTYWIHQGPDGEHWRDAAEVIPPMPGPVPGRGFPRMHVEYHGFTFSFASMHELDACAETLARKNLPTSRQRSAERGSGAGPNRHWLSRLPAKVTTWKYRRGVIEYLAEARKDFVDRLGGRGC